MIRTFFSCAIALTIVACANSDAPPVASPRAQKSDVCGHGPDARTCPAGYSCVKGTPPPHDADAEAPPRGPSYEGGGCGGIAGFHCADGLFCEMPPDQEMVADGMGTCAPKFSCQAPGQGCFGLGAACK